MGFFHWGPICATFIISSLSLACFYVNLTFFPPSESLNNSLSLLLLILWAFLILYNFFNSIFIGPGFVPFNWKGEPHISGNILQSCDICKGYKPPRAHHCRSCKRCVLKMDHHCPWINCCVGYLNHFYFCLFLFWAAVGCTHASILLGYILYLIVKEPQYHMFVKKNAYTIYILHIVAIGLAIGVVIFVSALLVLQIKNILYNVTSIEEWIIKKINKFKLHSESLKFENPYDIGWKHNIIQFLTHLKTISSGMNWPTREGYSQYSLSIEQIALKQLKDACSMHYICIKNYDGSLISFLSSDFDIRILFSALFIWGPRLSLLAGDKILVSRTKKYWLYGKKLTCNDNGMENNVTDKGWFPRRFCRKDSLMRPLPDLSLLSKKFK